MKIHNFRFSFYLSSRKYHWSWPKILDVAHF